MIKSEVVMLTPNLAASLLETNSMNRPISKLTLDRYEKAIRRGEWRLNGEPIIIFSNGVLGDGQHRCWAVINTGIPIETVIMYGISSEVFGTINQPKVRNTSDLLSIKGEKNTSKLSSAARSYLGEFLTARELSASTPTQIDKCLQEHPHIRYWVQKYVKGKNLYKFLPSSICAHMAIASEKYGFEKMDVFFEKLDSGQNLSAGDPALVLRERMLSQTKTQTLTVAYARAFIVKAINAHIIGTKLTFLRFTDREETPKIL